MQMRLDEIVVRKRIRRSIGDLGSLKDSLFRHGMLNPIVVNSANELVAGQRRLEAARQLGWVTVPVTVVDSVDEVQRFELEIDENLHRKPFTSDELATAYQKLDRLRNPGFFSRLWTALRNWFRSILGLFRRKRR